MSVSRGSVDCESRTYLSLTDPVPTTYTAPGGGDATC